MTHIHQGFENNSARFTNVEKELAKQSKAISA
jgi:hypothetical protein